ncbi:hypothetical protein [Nonomuraea dietziae]|uniref:hypothetical protein n=1 Tax=Nonomuraea dietziae TaxID=65515 RepID=UPI0031E37F7D
MHRFEEYYDQELYSGLDMSDSVMCDRESFAAGEAGPPHRRPHARAAGRPAPDRRPGEDRPDHALRGPARLPRGHVEEAEAGAARLADLLALPA